MIKDKRLKNKRCCICGKMFESFRTTQKVCGIECAVKYSQILAEKKIKKKIQEYKKDIKTRRDLLNELQKIFNTFIRLRDYGMPCISCGKPLYGKYDAGHFFSVGGHPDMRYDEENVHGQCVECNKYKHGNLINYERGLINRIGYDRFENLVASSEEKKPKITAEEIKEKIKYYKQKIKEMEDKRK